MSRIEKAKRRIEERRQRLQPAQFEERYAKPALYTVEEAGMEEWLAEREATLANASARLCQTALD